MALPTETTGYTYGWSPNDFIQNFLAEGSDNRGGESKGANEGKLSILEGDVVQIGTSFRNVKAYVYSGSTATVLGVALADAKNGEMVPVCCGPIVKCEAGGSITRGAMVGVSTSENALIVSITEAATTRRGVIGIALQDADDGDIIAVCLKTGTTLV